MGSIVIACFRPKPGAKEQLLAVIRDHRPTLAAEDLITDRDWIVMRGRDGTVVEIFEWRSRDAIEQAHSNPRVLALWERFEAVCEYARLAELAEANDVFPAFEPL